MALGAEAALLSADSGAVFAASLASSERLAGNAAETKQRAARGAASSADSVAAALLMARTQNRKIEVTSARTASSSTWALPSGELQTTAYTEPVRVKRGGDWHDVDTTLVDNGAALEPKSAAAEVTVSDGGDTALASVAREEKSFALG